MLDDQTNNKLIQLCHISNLAWLMNNYSVWYIRASFKSNKLTTEKFSRSLSLPHFLFQVFFFKKLATKFTFWNWPHFDKFRQAFYMHFINVNTMNL